MKPSILSIVAHQSYGQRKPRERIVLTGKRSKEIHFGCSHPIRLLALHSKPARFLMRLAVRFASRDRQSTQIP